MSDEPRVKSAHYRKRCDKCLYCGGNATIVRASILDNGDVYVASLCEAHGHGEAESLIPQGFTQPDPNKSDYFAPVEPTIKCRTPQELPS